MDQLQKRQEINLNRTAEHEYEKKNGCDRIRSKKKIPDSRTMIIQRRSKDTQMKQIQIKT